MKELSLFSGIGGGLLATQHLLGWETIGYVEKNDYCQRVIMQRIRDGLLTNAPIFSDIRTFISEGCCEFYKGITDVITAGFPCQPFSIAGKQAGADDTRNMWPETIECIRRIQPKYAFLENVRGLLTSPYISTIFGDLANSRYNCKWKVISAAEVGAPHKRDRLWIMAYPQSMDVAWGTSKKDRWAMGKCDKYRGSMWGGPRPKPCRMDDGLAYGMDRLTAIGNGQVPQVVATAWRILTL